MRARQVLHDERGASLTLALAFVLFISVFSVAILSFSGAGSVTSTIVSARHDQLYAAEGGMEYGIANLKADTTKCAASGSYTWPTTTVNGKTVTYGCTYVSGGSGFVGSPLLGEYGTIITGGGGITTNSNKSTGVVLDFDGSVHSAGGVTFGSPGDQSLAINGNLTVGGACPASGVTYTPPGACTGSTAVPAAPTLAVYVPSATAAAPTVSGSCTTLYPGKYGTGGQTIPTFSATGQYYLANGVYYVNGGTWTFNGTVFGGQPSASETKQMSLTPCRATDPASSGYSGSGVAFVLGGGATVTMVNSNARVELYARVPGGLDAGATAGLGIWANTSTTSVMAGGSYTVSTSPAGIVTIGHKDITAVLHGLTYVPTAPVQTFMQANAGTASAFMGGLVASALSVTVVNGDDGKTMHFSGTGGYQSSPRIVTLSSTAAGTNGAANTSVTATVSPDGTLSVSNWRVT